MVAVAVEEVVAAEAAVAAEEVAAVAAVAVGEEVAADSTHPECTAAVRHKCGSSSRYRCTKPAFEC